MKKQKFELLFSRLENLQIWESLRVVKSSEKEESESDENEENIEKWLQDLKSDDEDTRKEAVEMLGQTDLPNNPQMIQTFLELLKEDPSK